MLSPSLHATAHSRRISASEAPTAPAQAASTLGCSATLASMRSGKTLKPRILTWEPASRPQNSMQLPPTHRTRSPVL